MQHVSGFDREALSSTLLRRMGLMRDWDTFLSRYASLLMPVSGEPPFEDDLDRRDAAQLPTRLACPDGSGRPALHGAARSDGIHRHELAASRPASEWWPPIGVQLALRQSFSRGLVCLKWASKLPARGAPPASPGRTPSEAPGSSDPVQEDCHMPSLISSLRSGKAAMPFIMLTVLIDMIAIGLIIPVLPSMVGKFSSSPADQAWWYGVAAFSFGMSNFLASPVLGALSDRYGRRPVLLLGFLGLGLSFFGTALAEALCGTGWPFARQVAQCNPTWPSPMLMWPTSRHPSNAPNNSACWAP